MLAAYNVLAFETTCPVWCGNKVGCETRPYNQGSRGLKANQDVTFKAVYLSSQVDRKTDCFDGGNSGTGKPPTKYVRRYEVCYIEVCPWVGTDPATFKAVCGTQTRMPEGFNLMCNQTQALSTPDNLVGGAGNREPYRSIAGLNRPVMGELCLGEIYALAN